MRRYIVMFDFKCSNRCFTVGIESVFAFVEIGGDMRSENSDYVIANSTTNNVDQNHDW